MSTRFLDGPAAGVLLLLKRAPSFMRVVRSPAGEWDALDQLNDEPNPRELLYAYLRRTRPTVFHIRACRGASGFYCSADYAFVSEQPADAVMREVLAWRRWCVEHRPATAVDVAGGNAHGA